MDTEVSFSPCKPPATLLWVIASLVLCSRVGEGGTEGGTKKAATNLRIIWMQCVYIQSLLAAEREWNDKLVVYTKYRLFLRDSGCKQNLLTSVSVDHFQHKINTRPQHQVSRYKHLNCPCPIQNEAIHPDN